MPNSPRRNPAWQLSLQGERQEQISSASPVDYSLKLVFSSSFQGLFVAPFSHRRGDTAR